MNITKTYECLNSLVKHPCSWLIAGCSQAGKTYYTKEIILNSQCIFDNVFNEIIICFKEDQPSYHELTNNIPNVRLCSQIEDCEELRNCLIIFDDQMTENMKDKRVADLFTKGIHHKSNSVILLAQNLFCQGKFARDIKLNTQYMTIFKSPQFKSQIIYLGRQLFPDHPNFLKAAYEQATEKPYTNLFLDLHPNTHDHLRVKSNVLPNQCQIVYLPK